MARGKKQNPIYDITNMVTGWLGGDRPGTPMQVVRSKEAVKEIAKVADTWVAGGMGQAVIREAQGEQNAVVKQAAINLAAGAVAAGTGYVAGKAIGAVAESPFGQSVARKTADILYEMKAMKPVSAKVVRQQQKVLMQRIIAAEERAMEAEAQSSAAAIISGKKYPDMDYVKLFKQSLIEDDATRIAMAKGPESTPFTRSQQNAIRIEAANNRFLKTSEDVDRDIRLVNRYMREKGKWVSMRSRALTNDPEYRRQINEALTRQLAKSKGKRAMDEVMRNIVDEGLQGFK